ncbi:cuticle protein 16.8-like [Haemaphysalis longicornis]
MLRKVLLLGCLAAYATGQVVVQAPVHVDEPPQPYSFSYDHTDEFGTRTTREETSDENNNKVGSYSFTDAYGISRTVRYVADASGFHATIETNEPGTRTSNPADATITSSAVEPPPTAAAAVHAPVAVHAVHAEPVAIHGTPVAAHGAPVAVHAVHGAPVALHAAPVTFAEAHHAVPVTLGRAKSRR